MATHTHTRTLTHKKKQHEEWKKKQQEKETLYVCKVFRGLSKKCRSFEFMILSTQHRSVAGRLELPLYSYGCRLTSNPSTPYTHLNSSVCVCMRELETFSTIPFALCAALLQPRLTWKLIWKLLYSLQISRSRSMRIKMWSYPARWMRISAGNCIRWTGSREMIVSLPCCWAIVMWRAWTMNLRIGKWELENIFNIFT